MRTTTFRFGPVRQETGAKHVRQGDLLEAINVRQTAKAGVYAKRKAFKRTAQTFVGGSLSGTPASVLPGTQGSSLMRDSGGQLWARDVATNSWIYSGKRESLWPTTNQVQTGLYSNPLPFSCMVGTTLWVFALTTNAYEFTVIEQASKQSVTGKITVTATGIVHASAAYDGTSVWLFWVDGGANGTVRCHKLDPASPTTAPVATTYYQFPASPTNLSAMAVLQVQARYFSAAGKVFVCACGGTSTAGAMHSVLNPATGQAATGGQVATVSIAAASGAGAAAPLGALWILDGQDGSGSSWYYAVAGVIDSGGTRKMSAVKVTASAFATFSSTTIAISFSGMTIYAMSVVGVVDQSSGYQYILTTAITFGVQPWGDSGNSYRSNFCVINSSGGETDGPISVVDEIAAEWPASGFAYLNGSWILITGYDDFGWATAATFGSESATVQRSYHVYRLTMGGAGTSTFSLVSQFEMGNASALWGKASSNISVPPSSPVINGPAPLHVSGALAYAAASIASSVTGYVDIAVSTIDSAKAFSQDAQLGKRGYTAGNIPMTWSANSAAHPIAPLAFPPAMDVSAGTGSDYSIAAAVFSYYDADGTAWRSSPLVISKTFGHSATITVTIPGFARHGSVLMGIEIYIGNNGTPKLQTVMGMPAAANYVNFVTPAVASMVNGEILYTTGNSLSNTWPAPCQTVGTWSNRVFCSQGNELWVSKEVAPGVGPIFNEVQVSTWNEERNDITAIAPVDWNYLGICSENQISVVSGPGPDGVGNGNYVIKTLPSYTGVVSGGVALQGAQGMYYQNKGTGRIMCLQPSLQVMEAAGGAYDYASYNFSVAAWYESENLMVFFAPASGAAIVIDYQHPQEAVPFGQVYLWTFASGFVPAAACRDDSGLLVISSQGGVYRTTTNQWVDDNASGTTDTYQMKLATAELQIGDLQGSFNLNKLQALLAMRGASGVSIGVYPGYASATASDPRTTTVSIDLPSPTNSGDTESVMTRPANCMRIQSFRVVVLEKAGVTTQSFEFEGVASECFVSGKLLRPSEGRVI